MHISIQGFVMAESLANAAGISAKADDDAKLHSRRRKFPNVLILGAVFFSIITLVAIIGPFVSPYAYDEIHITDRFQPPNLNYFFGTDEYGRDVLSRTLYGTRMSLVMGITATLVSLLLGVPLGLMAGYYRGRVDEIIMRCLDVMIAFPPIILVLLILAVTGPGLWKTSITVGILFTPPMARITRSIALEIVSQEFILAAHARGESTSYILFREILPNALPPVIVEASLRITFAMLAAAVLSFLGLGVQPPSADWGLMISQARTFLQMAPWIALVPGTAMCITVLAVNFIGDGLREYLDPRERRRGEL
jgi:peptide/nickel transport system permease protein